MLLGKFFVLPFAFLSATSAVDGDVVIWDFSSMVKIGLDFVAYVDS